MVAEPPSCVCVRTRSLGGPGLFSIAKLVLDHSNNFNLHAVYSTSAAFLSKFKF